MSFDIRDPNYIATKLSVARRTLQRDRRPTQKLRARQTLVLPRDTVTLNAPLPSAKLKPTPTAPSSVATQASKPARISVQEESPSTLLAEQPSSAPAPEHSDSIDGFLTKYLPEERTGPSSSFVDKDFVHVASVGPGYSVRRTDISTPESGIKVTIRQDGISKTFVK